jgi:hypothetical protein
VRHARVADLVSSRPEASQIPIHLLCGTPVLLWVSWRRSSLFNSVVMTKRKQL